MKADKGSNIAGDYVTVVATSVKGGYDFDDINESNSYLWSIDKKDLKDCFVSVTKDKNGFNLVVMKRRTSAKAEVLQ